MTDLALAAGWLGVLGAGVVGAVWLRGLGLASTYVRDLLHVGAGVWVLGWPLWSGAVAPVAMAVGAALAIALVPVLAARSRPIRRLVRAVTGGDERWTGLVLYGAAFAAMTFLALARDPFPAAAALWALALGDGVGGAVGRRFGRTHYAAPGGKRKSAEGSLAVLACAAVGVWLAAVYFDAGVGARAIAAIAAVAAVAEAAAPRGTDNALIPAAVWSAAELLAGGGTP